jgi:hypothetical protein
MSRRLLAPSRRKAAYRVAHHRSRRSPLGHPGDPR